MKLSVQEFAGKIDHTLLKPYTSNEELKVHCEQAVHYGFKTVAINNAVIPFCRSTLEGSNVLCDAAVSFPLGQCTVETKVFETIDVIKKGAGEVDYVVNLVEVKNGNWGYIEDEMRRITAACAEKDVVSKVIFENCYLTDDEKKRLCDIALIVRPNFIKTSTGFGTGGATLEDIKLMKACVGNEIKIKAAGGIRTIDQALQLIEGGAGRIGTSQGIALVESYKTLL